jgi:uncharacterized protein (DUF924 family)
VVLSSTWVSRLPLWNNLLVFTISYSFDAEVQEKFGNLMLQARTTQLAPWVDKPTSSLALIILLDQLPRNVWRNSLNAFHSDAKALDVASRSIVKGFDREVTPWQQLFFYLPFMHGESVVSQVAGISLLEGAVQRVNDSESAEAKCLSMGLDSAKKHAVPISKFGRFPGRNVALGRDTTEEEAAFLKEFPGGF